MIKDKDGIIQCLSWVELLLNIPSKTRKKMRKICLNGLNLFKKGKPSQEGSELVRFLKEDCEFIGYATNIQYVMESGETKEQEDSLWSHPFSIPTVLYKVKGVPMIVVANENLDYNNNVLDSIPSNKSNSELDDFIKGVKGIQG